MLKLEKDDLNNWWISFNGQKVRQPDINTLCSEIKRLKKANKKRKKKCQKLESKLRLK